MHILRFPLLGMSHCSSSAPAAFQKRNEVTRTVILIFLFEDLCVKGIKRAVLGKEVHLFETITDFGNQHRANMKIIFHLICQLKYHTVFFSNVLIKLQKSYNTKNVYIFEIVFNILQGRKNLP